MRQPKIICSECGKDLTELLDINTILLESDSEAETIADILSSKIECKNCKTLFYPGYMKANKQLIKDFFDTKNNLVRDLMDEKMKLETRIMQIEEKAQRIASKIPDYYREYAYSAKDQKYMQLWKRIYNLVPDVIHLG